MDRKWMNRHRFLYVAAVFVLALGCLAAAVLTTSTLISYPSLIKEAYSDPLHKVEIPGEAEINLSRKGAYAVYFESAVTPVNGPPLLNCSLTSVNSGDDIPLVPDYVPTNRYVTQDDQVGTLIYSTTIEDPGLHTLSCGYVDGGISPKLVLAIGPNYVFEFLRVAWNMSRSLLGSMGVLCGSVVLSMGIAVFALLGSRNKRAVVGGIHS